MMQKLEKNEKDSENIFSSDRPGDHQSGLSFLGNDNDDDSWLKQSGTITMPAIFCVKDESGIP